MSKRRLGKTGIEVTPIGMGTIGISEADVSEIDAIETFIAAKDMGVDLFDQIPYSILDRRAESDILPYCQKHGLGTLIRGALHQGMLTGKFKSDTTFDNDMRKKWNETKRQEFLSELRATEALNAFVTDARSMGQIALRYVLDHPAVSCVIPGIKSPEQARANVGALEVTLSKQERDEINALFPIQQ